jgi:hypothetical protein
MHSSLPVWVIHVISGAAWDFRFSPDCVAKLKNGMTAKFRNLPVEMDFRRYDPL